MKEASVRPESVRSPKSHATATEAARALAAQRGLVVRGGCIFTPEGGAPLARGWAGYATLLCESGEIYEEGDEWRIREDPASAEDAGEVTDPTDEDDLGTPALAARVRQKSTGAAAKPRATQRQHLESVPPQADTQKIAVEIDADLMNWLDRYAAAVKRDPGELLGVALEEELVRQALTCSVGFESPMTIPSVLRAVLGVALDREIGEKEDLFALLSEWIRAAHEKRDREQEKRPVLARGSRCVVVDPSGAALARYAYSEVRRRGFLPRNLSFEAWMVDAIVERSYLIAQELLGVSQERPVRLTPELRQDGRGGVSGIRTYHLA